MSVESLIENTNVREEARQSTVAWWRSRHPGNTNERSLSFAVFYRVGPGEGERTCGGDEGGRMDRRKETLKQGKERVYMQMADMEERD